VQNNVSQWNDSENETALEMDFLASALDTLCDFGQALPPICVSVSKDAVDTVLIAHQFELLWPCVT